jgi:dCMP deaminase
MRKSREPRPAKDLCYLDIAERVALRSTCLRRNYGAVIVNHDEILATGYAGAPRQTINCTTVGYCYRDQIGARRGEHYELCRAVHAEQNAIIQARRLDMLGSTLYLVGLDAEDGNRLADAAPCPICRRVIINAGIKKVVVGLGGKKTKTHAVKKWIDNSLWELAKRKGKLVPVEPPPSLSQPVDQQRQRQLVKRFGLSQAVVVQTPPAGNRRHTVARAAARFFTSKVKDGASVALSCGDTILCMLEYLPYRLNRKIIIHQLSVEADPTTIHQAPATLVGLLRAKHSPASQVYGLQLPPFDLTPSCKLLRKELAQGKVLKNMRAEARKSDFVFLGVGSVDGESPSFWAVAQAATARKFHRFVKALGIAGEINNQVFDALGHDCTSQVAGLSDHLINVLTLDDIRRMAANSRKQKVVMVATGEEKTGAIRAALQAGLANVLITGSDDAERLVAAPV